LTRKVTGTTPSAPDTESDPVSVFIGWPIKFCGLIAVATPTVPADTRNARRLRRLPPELRPRDPSFSLDKRPPVSTHAGLTLPWHPCGERRIAQSSARQPTDRRARNEFYGFAETIAFARLSAGRRS
jgi:hypothetical protein